MSVTVDASQLHKLAADFGHASGAAVVQVAKVVEKAALNVKTTMVTDAESSGHYKHFSRSISYDRAASVGSIAYEVGPDKGRTQGALGNILYFGTSNNAPVLDIEAGLIEEEPRFTSALATLAAKLALGNG